MTGRRRLLRAAARVLAQLVAHLVVAFFFMPSAIPSADLDYSSGLSDVSRCVMAGMYLVLRDIIRNADIPCYFFGITGATGDEASGVAKKAAVRDNLEAGAGGEN